MRTNHPNQSSLAYAKEMGWVDADYCKYDWQPNWNVPPGSEPMLMCQLDGTNHVNSVPWGYADRHGKWFLYGAANHHIAGVLEHIAEPHREAD